MMGLTGRVVNAAVTVAPTDDATTMPMLLLYNEVVKAAGIATVGKAVAGATTGRMPIRSMRYIMHPM